MATYNVELLPAAENDLDDIFDYILLDNPDAAEKVLDEIITSLKLLEDFPLAGAKLLEGSLVHYEFRMVISDPYVSFYRVSEDTVFVYRILHGARDYIRILKNNK